MSTNITNRLAGIVALFTGGSRGIGAAIPRRLATDEADVVSVFVTNGGYNGVQQVLRLSTPLAPKPHQTSKTSSRIVASSRGTPKPPRRLSVLKV